MLRTAGIKYSYSGILDIERSRLTYGNDIFPGDNTPVVSLLPSGGITDPNWGFWIEQGFSPFPCALTVFSNFRPLNSDRVGFSDSLVTHPMTRPRSLRFTLNNY